MCDKLYLCTLENKCPIGEDEELFKCCAECEEPCENACVLNRKECIGSIIFDSSEYCVLNSCFFPSAKPAECGEAI